MHKLKQSKPKVNIVEMEVKMQEEREALYARERLEILQIEKTAALRSRDEGKEILISSISAVETNKLECHSEEQGAGSPCLIETSIKKFLMGKRMSLSSLKEGEKVFHGTDQLDHTTTRSATTPDRENSNYGKRPGYISAREKIKRELVEMKKREVELRRQRARQSQPDLQRLIEEEEEEDYALHEPFKLRSAVSFPNMLNLDERQNSKKIYAEKPQIKRNALIEMWESMIKNN